MEPKGFDLSPPWPPAAEPGLNEGRHPGFSGLSPFERFLKWCGEPDRHHDHHQETSGEP